MFGKNIKKLRNVKGLSQQAFAELFGLQRATLGAYEEGRSNPKIETIITIAHYFNISIDELLTSELTVNRLLHFNDHITVNSEGLRLKEFAQIPCITEALQTDYLHQYSNKTFTERLPHIQLPLDSTDGVIAFTVTGLELTSQGKGFFPKDIVFGRLVPPVEYALLKPTAVALVQTEEKFILRRVSVSPANDIIRLAADYDALESIELPVAHIVQLWEICHVFHYRIAPKEDLLEERLAMLEKKILSLNNQGG